MTTQELHGFDLMLSRALEQLEEPRTDKPGMATEQVDDIEDETTGRPSNKRRKIDDAESPQSPGSIQPELKTLNDSGQENKPIDIVVQIRTTEATRSNDLDNSEPITATGTTFDKVVGHFYNRHGTMRIKLTKSGYDYVAVMSFNEALGANRPVICQYIRNLNTKARNNLVRRIPGALECLKTE